MARPGNDAHGRIAESRSRPGAHCARPSHRHLRRDRDAGRRARRGGGDLSGTRRAPSPGRRPDVPLASACVAPRNPARSEEHTSELQSRRDLVCRLLLEKKKKNKKEIIKKKKKKKEYINK